MTLPRTVRKHACWQLDEILRRRETAGQSSWSFYRSGITLVLFTLFFTTLKRAGRAAGSKRRFALSACACIPLRSRQGGEKKNECL
jgi:hypothetical protein